MNKKLWKWFGMSLILLALTACNASGKEGGQFASLPVGKAYSEGKEIFFAHTEASDPEIAKKLTNMMKSPVLLVPSLAQAPDAMLARVYVFANGIKGKGPLGYQMDVFDAPPEMAEKYSPLRRLITVQWNDPSKSREMKSAGEIQTAETDGELITQKTNVVINMPFITWQSGQR